MSDLGDQHTHMYEYGDGGTRFSIDAMRRSALLRLKNHGWTTTIHRHEPDLPCGDDPDWDACEHYNLTGEHPEETTK